LKEVFLWPEVRIASLGPYLQSENQTNPQCVKTSGLVMSTITQLRDIRDFANEKPSIRLLQIHCSLKKAISKEYFILTFHISIGLANHEEKACRWV
jgi:hypothetical protein